MAYQTSLSPKLTGNIEHVYRMTSSDWKKNACIDLEMIDESGNFQLVAGIVITNDEEYSSRRFNQLLARVVTAVEEAGYSRSL